MIIKGKSFPVPPEGRHAAMCESVTDLGVVQTPFGNKEKVRIVWKLRAVDATGKPFTVRQDYTRSLSPKAKLRQHIEGWLGRELRRDEAGRFDTEVLIGLPCELEIVHNTGSTGAVFANVEAVLESAVPF